MGNGVTIMDKCGRCKKRPANMGTYSPTGLLLSKAGFSTDMKLCSKCVKELKRSEERRVGKEC